MLSIRSLRASLGRTPVLHGISASAAAGRIVAVIGPNGSGKTTLLRAISGDVAYDGRIALDGDDLADLKPWELAARRGVLPQAAALAFPFTVAEVVRLGLTSGTQADRADLIGRALAEVDLAGFSGRYYQELSGGQQARVQLARVRAQVWEPVVAGRPRWLFLDEPVAALDIAHQIGVMRVLRRFADAGGGVVIVLHDLNLAAMVADDVWLINDGLLLDAGSPARVIGGPALAEAYGCPIKANRLPDAQATFVLPHGLWTAAG
ncbi:heme ABC transporter ATP-binding protein [Yoonia vestfoldensis]|uniref:heme ABC transporter ATP-binding protein n=1 Tax=Yoonia vestfoldensis TaxID=245188 RepID=UPI000475EC48|nr:heme ABC transporter ATP-binding protein [Yoonia vestfoldensis]